MLLRHLLQHELHARIVSRVQVLERHRVVALARPPNRGQVGVVVQPEILEWAQQPALHGVPESQFHGDAVVEVVQDVFGVRSLWRGREAQKDPGPLSAGFGLASLEEMVQQTPLCGRRGMVIFVDDDDVEGEIATQSDHGRRQLCSTTAI